MTEEDPVEPLTDDDADADADDPVQEESDQDVDATSETDESTDSLQHEPPENFPPDIREDQISQLYDNTPPPTHLNVCRWFHWKTSTKQEL